MLKTVRGRSLSQSLHYQLNSAKVRTYAQVRSSTATPFMALSNDGSRSSGYNHLSSTSPFSSWSRSSTRSFSFHRSVADYQGKDDDKYKYKDDEDLDFEFSEEYYTDDDVEADYEDDNRNRKKSNEEEEEEEDDGPCYAEDAEDFDDWEEDADPHEAEELLFYDKPYNDEFEQMNEEGLPRLISMAEAFKASGEAPHDEGTGPGADAPEVWVMTPDVPVIVTRKYNFDPLEYFPEGGFETYIWFLNEEQTDYFVALFDADEDGNFCDSAWWLNQYIPGLFVAPSGSFILMRKRHDENCEPQTVPMGVTVEEARDLIASVANMDQFDSDEDHDLL